VRDSRVPVLVVVCLALAGGLGGCAGAEAQVAEAVETDVADHLEARDPSRQVRAVLVHHGGDPVVELYQDAEPDEYWNSWSVTKSAVSALVGIAIEDGSIPGGVEATLGELLPEQTADLPEDVQAITLHEVLTHTAGFSDSFDYRAHDDWLAAILAERADNPVSPGEFTYSNAGTQVLVGVLTVATGRSVLDYANEALFGPLGLPVEDATDLADDLDAFLAGDLAEEELERRYESGGFVWPASSDGENDGACCLRLRPADMARIGQLYLDGGRWDGEQVVPEEWVAASTQTQVEAGPGELSDGYGYQWWVTEVDGSPVAYALGTGGQTVAVVPDRGLVVAVSTEALFSGPRPLSTSVGPDLVARLVEHFPPSQAAR
jgi:CubicO group peptidase (beta-lactamase class C family)